jgi:hypothetical protein
VVTLAGQVLRYLLGQPLQKSNVLIQCLGQPATTVLLASALPLITRNSSAESMPNLAPCIWTFVSWVTHGIPMCWEKA